MNYTAVDHTKNSLHAVHTDLQEPTRHGSSGVPYGSVLGPILFLLYTADVALIAKKQEINVHSCADHSELYIYGRADETAVTLPRVISCINSWMRSIQLKLNTDKTVYYT